jgi:hypothetical protein
MRVENNFVPYPLPKRALFYQTGNDYIKNTTTGLLGWSKIEIEVEVIGEDDTCFVTELKKHRISDTTDKDYGKIVLLPLGFHKSRLIKWIPIPGQQLLLFD